MAGRSFFDNEEFEPEIDYSDIDPCYEEAAEQVRRRQPFNSYGIRFTSPYRITKPTNGDTQHEL